MLQTFLEPRGLQFQFDDTGVEVGESHDLVFVGGVIVTFGLVSIFLVAFAREGTHLTRFKNQRVYQFAVNDQR